MIRDLIALASIGATGENQEVLVKEWDRIFKLAQEHNVLPLVATAILSMPTHKCPTYIYDCILNITRNVSSQNLIRKQRIVRLFAEMQAIGIKAIILKGETVARYYAYPESRSAVDTDIWIPEEQEQAAYSFFAGKGFEITKRNRTSHHGICQHKRYGKIELHTKLYDDIVADVWFRGLKDEDLLCEEFENIQTEDGGYSSLGPTDQLLFMTLHMIKHFIDGGLTLGMMIDLALCYENNWNRIDDIRYWRIIGDLHYSRFVKTVYGIMTKYGGCKRLATDNWGECSEEQMVMLLRDLELGGYMGRIELQERYEAGMEYNRRLIMQTRSRSQYVFYMIGWKLRSASKRMFLSCGEIRKQYPVVAKFVFLTPFAWIYQAVSYPINKITGGVLKREIRLNNTGLSVVAQRRIEMFEFFEMF